MSIIGYSLGGGIAVNFAATFPHMVQSLILLAPAGLIRAENIGHYSRLIFTSGVVPERLLETLTRRRLRTPIGNAMAKKRRTSTFSEADKTVLSPLGDGSKEGFIDAAVEEAVDLNTDDDTLDSPSHVEANIAAFLRWMLDAHQGFVPSFMSTIRYGPLLGQQSYWRELAKRQPGTTAVILGRNDELIQKGDYKEDALPLMGGEKNVFWRVVPGGHNMPFTNSKEVLEAIHEFWDLGG